MASQEFASARGNGVAGYSTILQTVTTVALFVGGFWAGVIAPISERQRLLETEMRNYIGKEEHAEFKLRIDKDLDTINARIIRQNTQVVPRPENEVRWKASEDTQKLLSDRLNELRIQTSSAYTMRDEVMSLRNELIEMRKRLMQSNEK